MIAFDMKPHASVLHGYKVRDMIARATTLRVMSSTENDMVPIPFYVENGGLLRGRIVLHIFCGVSKAIPSTLSLSNAAPAGGYDTAACLNSVLDGVAGLLVTVATQAGRRNTQHREKKIRVQRGIGSFYPAHVATMVGNMFGAPVTHYEINHMLTTMSTLLTMGGLDFIAPERRIGEFLLSCYQRYVMGAIAEPDMNAMRALITLTMGVQTYNQLVRHYGEGGQAPEVEGGLLDKLVNMIARAEPGRRRRRIHSFIKKLATVQINAMLNPPSGQEEAHSNELHAFGDEIISALREGSFEGHYSTAYRRAVDDAEEAPPTEEEFVIEPLIATPNMGTPYTLAPIVLSDSHLADGDY